MNEIGTSDEPYDDKEKNNDKLLLTNITKDIVKDIVKDIIIDENNKKSVKSDEEILKIIEIFE